MINRWSKQDAEHFCSQHASLEPEIALQVYATRLLGKEPELVLHGGGNTSIKTTHRTILGNLRNCLNVKASGANMASLDSSGFISLDLEFLESLKVLDSLTDRQMADEFRTHYLVPNAALPSIETLMHAFLPFSCIDHSHPEIILVLTNRLDGTSVIADAFGGDIASIPYARVGFDLARAVAQSAASSPDAIGVIIAQHGLVTWGATAQEAYERTIRIVDTAEQYLASVTRRSITISSTVPQQDSKHSFGAIAPLLRSLLCTPSGNPDMPCQQVILQLLNDESILKLTGSEQGKSIAVTPPLTPDYLIRTRAFPLWIDTDASEDSNTIRQHIKTAVDAYVSQYKLYLARNAAEFQPLEHDLLPKVIIIPGLGAICSGADTNEASMVGDITRQALRVKRLIFETGGEYQALGEEHLIDMEFRSFQRAKLSSSPELELQGRIALVTGSAGAIGYGICEGLLRKGCHVALTDLDSPSLDNAATELAKTYGARVAKIALDVTSEVSVAEGFSQVIRHWGGLDIAIVNAGIAHVSPLSEMDLDKFRKLELVNVDGTLLTIREAARHFKLQGTGGDIILISTKNVFAPSAKFGAYSATKAASHQLARIASLELAEIGVRVNMVAPDAVFSHGAKRSGLWAEVGPDRMKARGLDEAGLEEYYRSRNLLKAKITAGHVARAVLFFVTHQTPTTGATIPVDGGLPDATPR